MKTTSPTKRYSGRAFPPEEIAEIRHLIESQRGITRQQLSYRVCEQFDWHKPDGSLKDMSARVALLRMHREGLIELPAPHHKVNPCRSFARRTTRAEPATPLQVPVKALTDLRLELVQRGTSALWNEYIDRYHYLGFKPLPGAQLRYFAMADEQVVGLLGFGAAAWKSAPRDEWIGWSRAQRRCNLSGVVNNCRFLILPWIRVEHLASKLLAMAARALPAHWQGGYGYRPMLLETFVEVERFAGTCYRAANWRCLGHTLRKRQAWRSSSRAGADQDGVGLSAGQGFPRAAMSVEHEQPEQIDAEEVERLIALADQGRLDAAAQRRLVPLLQTLMWLQHKLLETRISLSKLRRILFGKPTEKPPRPPEDPPSGDAGQDHQGQGETSVPPDDGQRMHGDEDPGHGSSHDSIPNEPPSAEPPTGETKTDKPAPAGHGRLGADDYPGAKVHRCDHQQLAPGDQCPQCGHGRLYTMAPLVRLRFTEQPLAMVTRYELQRLRCASCGAIIVAHLPPEAPRERYDVSLKVMLALSHSLLGLPFKRIEMLQQALGLPLPDATQFELVEAVANGVYPVFEYLKSLGAQQPLVYQDDTGTRVLSLIKANQADPPPARKAMYTTVLRFEGEHSIYLYFTGRQHAGENLDDILALRNDDLPAMLWMSDALAANTPKRHADRVVDLNCLTHGRRQFIEIAEYFPSECAHIIEAIATVYHHDAQCKDKAFTAEQRLLYHQSHSAPVMDALKTWMERQLDERRVEPNSRLGGAFAYLLNHWSALTRFLHLPGAPLDNNLAEQVLKAIVRYRNNSLFYRNEHGAYVGDVLISLIQTCRLNDINPFDYLSALLHHRSAVFADPGAWLPWTYQQTLTTLEQTTPLSNPSPVLGHGSVLGVAVP